ncbi:MAG TPA: GNAT family N-acetyltransferase [Candidatus Acidoferrum sp.]|nr:GNAT family N-acetyltransferase [Candidatus Acidoferrum sp.]
MNATKKREEISIRGPRMEDAAALARLATQLGYPSTPEQVVPRLEAILRDPMAVLFVVERASGEVTGFIHLMHQHLIEYDQRVEVAGLVVDEECRGMGIGRALMARAEEWAVERGCRHINVRSKISRAAAHAFYEGLGYEHYKSQKAFRKDLKPPKS